MFLSIGLLFIICCITAGSDSIYWTIGLFIISSMLLGIPGIAAAGAVAELLLSICSGSAAAAEVAEVA